MPAKQLILIAAACASAARAQDRLTVPLSSPSQPATVNVRLISGSITVSTGAASQVIVDVANSSGQPRGPEPPAGMHRIDAGRGGIDATEDHNTVTIGSRGGNSHADLTIQVPPNCSLKLRTINGSHVDVTGVSGEIEIDNNNGAISLKNVSGSVVAHSLNGSITASIDRAAPGKPMSFTSLNGKIDVTLPADAKARLRLKTDHGAVFTDFDVKMEAAAAKPVVADARNRGGKYQIQMERGVYGSINGGGPEYRFETLNGDILIHKK